MDLASNDPFGLAVALEKDRHEMSPRENLRRHFKQMYDLAGEPTGAGRIGAAAGG